MITRCFGGPDLLGLDEAAFIRDVAALMTLVVPAAIWYALWRILVSNRMTPRGGFLSLVLNESTATHPELYGRRFSGWTLGLYALTGLLTFILGLTAFDFYHCLCSPFG